MEFFLNLATRKPRNTVFNHLAKLIQKKTHMGTSGQSQKMYNNVTKGL